MQVEIEWTSKVIPSHSAIKNINLKHIIISFVLLIKCSTSACVYNLLIYSRKVLIPFE